MLETVSAVSISPKWFVYGTGTEKHFKATSQKLKRKMNQRHMHEEIKSALYLILFDFILFLSLHI
jgi:hypothetical protein